MVKAAFISTLAALVGCSPFGGASEFHCDRDDQCTSAAGGMCQPDGFCSFASTTCASGQVYGEHSGSLSGTCVGGGMMADAAIDAPSMCVASSKSCFNHAIETCNATGTGFDPAQRVPCALTCTGTTPACVAASNIMTADQLACGANATAPALAPTTGTLTINQDNIACSAGCGGGINTINRTSMNPNSFYCLSQISIPAAVTVQIGNNVDKGVTLYSQGPVAIAATIAFDGGNAASTLDANAGNDTPGAGGPGGGIGGALSNDDTMGNAGTGPCPGLQGTQMGTGTNSIGGGGGGGGGAGTGGKGGTGRKDATGMPVGGNGGANTCGTVDARPLIGGSGGGGGGDGSCGAGIACGWPGGGGGGALHIVSRSMISGAGTLSASGGSGTGENTRQGGGGGGGGGGMLLLEAPTLAFTGTLRVNGGTGGESRAGNGGAGASAGTINGTNGPSSNANDQGGGGAGGGGGRIRINAGTGASCGNATPAASCSTGTLRATP